MSLDPYQLCPCGSGKKIRFCCSKDITADLDKVMRAVQGDQRAYALTTINKLIQDKGPRLALLALKADVELSLDQIERADETIDEFLRKSPDNPVALSLSAIHACHKADLETAIEDLQQALEKLSDTVPASVYSAIGYVGRTLLSMGDVLAARGHFMLQAGMAGERDAEPIKLLMRINMMPEIPLLLKEDFPYARCPDGAEWSDRFDEATQLAQRGAWIAACEALDELEEDVPDQPAILKNLAILSGWVGQRDEATMAWRKYSRLNDLPLVEAVEAEARAGLLDPNPTTDEIDSVLLTYEVSDTEKLMERLLSSKRVSQVDYEPHEEDRDQPPPKAVFLLLDKEIPDASPELTIDMIPNALGELYVYGRETDRGPRVELAVLRDEHFEAAKQTLTDLAGEYLESDPQEVVEGQVDKASSAMSWRWRLPNDLTAEQRKELVQQQRRHMMLSRWPELKMQALDGKTPREAAANPAEQKRVLAALLLLELANQAQGHEYDFNELRRELGLPTRDAIDPASVSVDEITLPQLALLEVDKLTDDDLYKAYRQAVLRHVIPAIRSLATEALKREQLRDRIGADEAYEMLLRTASDSSLALQYAEQAKQAAIDRGESPARWLLAELSLRLSRLEIDEAQELIRVLQSRHIREPQIAEGLFDILTAYGIISPDGRPVVTREAAAAAQRADEPVMAAAEPGSKLWTPDSTASTPSGESKSKLWVPGMD